MATYKSDMVFPKAKRPKINPLGQNAWLHPDKTVTYDETKIIRVQRLVKDTLYRPGGVMWSKTLKKYM